MQSLAKYRGVEVLYFLVFLFSEWSRALCNYKLLVTSFAA